MLWRKLTNAIIERKLLFRKGATMVVTSDAGVESTIDLAEIAALDGIAASDLAKIDGITNGTVVAGKAVVVDSNKDASAFRNVTVTNLDSGASGTAGTVDVFPATASKGKIAITAADNAGDTTTTIVNAEQAGARTYTIPDAGASASFVMTEGAQTINGVKTFGGIPVFPTGGITAGATTVTETELGALDGVVVANSVASKAALVDSDKKLQTNASNGTLETGVTAVHYGDGVNVTAVLTLTNVAVTVGSSENLGVGALIYTLPAGACLIRDAYMSVAISGVTTTTDTPEIGLGTVIASGAVTVLSGTATFEDIITGQVAADTNGTATVKGVGPTAGAPLEITTGGAHTVHVNLADGWGANADAVGVLNGTVVLSYIRQAA